MSAISGISQSLYPVVNGVSSTASTQQSLAATDTSSQLSQQISGTGHHHKHHKNGDLFQQLQDSVTSALQNAQNGQSTSGTNGTSAAGDPNKIIEDAIARILQQNGANSSDADGDGNTDPAGGDGSSASASTSSSTSSSSGSTSSQQAFFQTLQENGVSPQQFRSDFLSAIQQAQNGQTNTTNPFGSFPPGLVLDTTA